MITPPLSSGCLEGVTRGVLMEIANEASVSVVEQTMQLEDLYGADEVFMTSTNRNVIGVKEIAGHTIADGITGPITKKIAETWWNDKAGECPVIRLKAPVSRWSRGRYVFWNGMPQSQNRHQRKSPGRAATWRAIAINVPSFENE